MSVPPSPPVTVVGIGADGWDGLTGPAREALRAARAVLGSVRQLALLPDAECPGERVAWPSPLLPTLPGLLATYRDRGLCVLASGDPMFYGIGRAVSQALRAEAGAAADPAALAARLRVLPAPSSLSLACARLGWALDDTDVVSLVGRPLDSLSRSLHPGRRVLVLSAGSSTPAEVAALLRDRGFGPSRLHLLEQLGGPGERLVSGTASGWDGRPADPLNVLGVECAAAPGALRLSAAPGLPDAAYAHDGQLTKRHVRAVTLAALAPAPGELLWDVGGGSGSIAVEWARTHPGCRAVSVERDPVRAERIEANARTLGVPAPAVRVVTGAAPGALTGLGSEGGAPAAVFVGGGLTAPGLLEACWDALLPGGRLVANAVTLESEAVLAGWYARHGGELVRLAVSHASPVGGFTGWRAALPVTQWTVTKPPPAEGRPEAEHAPQAGSAAQAEHVEPAGSPANAGIAETNGSAGNAGTSEHAGEAGAATKAGTEETNGSAGNAADVETAGKAGAVASAGNAENVGNAENLWNPGNLGNPGTAGTAANPGTAGNNGSARGDVSVPGPDSTSGERP